MSSTPVKTNRITASTLKKLKQAGEKFAMLTAYDASFASIIEQAGVEVILVGDSMGMIIQGHDSTIPVTVDDILYHCQCVSRVCQSSMIMADMPFMSFANVSRALDNATRLMQEGGAQAVKLEGGGHVLPVVEALAKHGIPVCAHLGLQPQYIHKIGAYRVQGREQDSAKTMLHEARVMQESGADFLLLECVPESLAEAITAELSIPTIGIGAGRHCDAQVLVLYDLLGISFGKTPKFAKNFLGETGSIQQAIQAFVSEVKSGRFPTDEHTFK